MSFHPSPYSPKMPDLGNYGLTAHRNAPQRTTSRLVSTLSKGKSLGTRHQDVPVLHNALLDWDAFAAADIKSGGYKSEYNEQLFGKNTEKVVKAFQKKEGLTQDGIVGKNTWARLSKYGDTDYVTNLPPSLSEVAAAYLPSNKGYQPSTPKQGELTQPPTAKTKIYQRAWFWPAVAGGSILLIGGFLIFRRTK